MWVASVLTLVLSPRANAKAPVEALAPELNAYVKLSDEARLFLLGNLSNYDNGDLTSG